MQEGQTHTTILVLGAAGAGVSNIAQIYHQQGHRVIAVDRQENAATDNLTSLGIEFHSEEEAVELGLAGQVDQVFRSSAVLDTNSLVQQALEAGIPVIGRHEFFALISQQKRTIAIAGSSGKTSVTGMVAHIFSGYEDCGYLVGIHGQGGHWGEANRFIIEADEYAKTFLSLEPVETALITNLSYDHVDIYPRIEEYHQAFRTFMQTAKESGGKVIIMGDNPQLREVATGIDPIRYGRNPDNDWTVDNVINYEGGSKFSIVHHSLHIANISLQVIGGHNIVNALAAFVIAYENGIPVEMIEDRLASFQGLPRRLELLRKEPYFVYDDYAHLPNEIETVLSGVAESFPRRRIVCYWQPHTYARANSFYHAYTRAFAHCDILFVGDVYAARDSGTFDYQRFVSQVNAREAVHSGDIEQSRTRIESAITDGDVLVCLNAGTGTQIAHYFATKK